MRYSLRRTGIALALALAACAKQSPLPKASFVGIDQGGLTIATGQQIILDATSSTDPSGGPLSFVPDFLMGDDPSTVQDELRAALRGLLDLDFDHLLFAHGEPLIGDGKAALRDFASHRSPTSARPAASRVSR